MEHNTKLNESLSASSWFISAMERLVDVVQELSHARDLNAIMYIVRDAARALTGADGATFVLREGDSCYYAEENAINPLWKGKRFPIKQCISGWVMDNAQAALIEDIYNDPRIPIDAYRPTSVKSLVMVPIRKNKPVGAIGNYWAISRKPREEEVKILQALADATSVAIENTQLLEELQNKMQMLEEREQHIRKQHEALEVFTRALAHDLKEPMRTIVAFTGLIDTPHATAQEKTFYFEHIKNASTRMAMLIETVFNYMQLDNPTEMVKESCDMQQVVIAVRDNLQQLIKERKTVIICEALPIVEANYTHMIQLMQNLLSNAIHHNEHAVTIRITAEKKEGAWVFAVNNNGVVIQGKHLEKIFLPFKRLHNKEECAGLGLSFCKKILEYHGGTIWCESEEKSGTSFFFTLPRIEIAKESGEHAKPNALVKLLLVDDREADIKLTRLLLIDCHGMECSLFIACDGTQALEILEEEKQKGEPIDLVLLDINMPEMDGFELLEHMQRRNEMQRTAVIMCTGSTYWKDMEQAKTLGAVGYLTKPPSFELLKDIIQEQVPHLGAVLGTKHLLHVRGDGQY